MSQDYLRFPDTYFLDKKSGSTSPEIMAGKIPISEEKVSIPRGLHQVILGSQTAREILWLK